ncbi:MAG TPA: M20 family metallopeptidase [Bacteroidales bacterium]|nr:M20 family metallopeptidase [Bacteroidales bacterium]HPT03490.1 M20 family metallopeptidase [Bacteroidales bacterium]
MMLKEQIRRLASKYAGEMIEIRRYLHANPELSEKEDNTSAYLREKLAGWGIPFKANVGGFGIIAEIRGQNPESRTIALRADMDALPVNEINDVAYKSCNEGVMHACGHDVHMSCLLGAARILHEVKEQFEGTLRLIFQPSEEKFPGGALAMIREGVLENPRPVQILGLHVLPTLEAGKAGFRSGRYMASTDEIYLTVKGKGGHAATPDLNIDTVLIASHIVVALQQVVSRCAPPGIPTVLSFGRFIADGRTNIIPGEVKIDGTIRTFDEAWRSRAHEKITTLAQGIARSMGGECEVFIDKGYPYLVNDEELTSRSKQLAIEYLGAGNVVETEQRMTAEDFAYYSHIIPACFYRLGVKNPEWKEVRNLHTPEFDADEKSIEVGMGLIAWLAVGSGS